MHLIHDGRRDLSAPCVPYIIYDAGEHFYELELWYNRKAMVVIHRGPGPLRHSHGRIVLVGPRETIEVELHEIPTGRVLAWFQTLDIPAFILQELL